MDSSLIKYGTLGALSLGAALIVNMLKTSKTEKPQLTQEKPIQQSIRDIYVRISAKQNMAVVHDLCNLNCMQKEKIMEPYEYTLNRGGKKMRLVMAVMVTEMFTGADPQGKIPKQILQVGGLIQLLHSASLIIDDIEDGSLHRRGEPCSYLVYGLDRSINAANCMYFLPFWKIYEATVNVEKKIKILKIFVEQMTVSHMGQAQDVMVHKTKSGAQLPQLSEYEVLTIAKTSSLLRMMIKMLCVFLDRSERECQQLCEVMNYVGLAFQVTDDVLNLTKNLGKGQIAEDLKQKKFTPIIHEMRDHQEFINLFIQEEKDDQTIKKMLQMILESKALQKAKELAQKYELKAEELMKKIETPYSKRDFERLMKFIITRQN